MIGLLAVDGLVRVTQPGQGGGREQLVDNLGFLQTQHIRLVFPQKSAHQGDAVTHRIDVPGGDPHFLHPFHAALAQQINNSLLIQYYA